MITYTKVTRNYGTQGDPNKKIAYMRGLSSDEKPTEYANGSEFYEMDTDVKKYFNEDTLSWIKSGELRVKTLAITTAPTKVSYTEGDKFDPTGVALLATYADNTTKALDKDDVTYNLTGDLTVDDEAVTFSYIFNGMRYTVDQAITVSEMAAPTVSGMTEGTVFGVDVTTLQDDLTVGAQKITGELSYIDSGVLAKDWGPGYFMALQFAATNWNAYDEVLVGLDPSVSSGLVSIKSDPDKNGVFKVTDKSTQKFVMQYQHNSAVRRVELDLSELDLAE